MTRNKIIALGRACDLSPYWESEARRCSGRLSHIMSLSASELWNSWRESAEIRDLAEGWITKPVGEWSSAVDALYGILHREPERALTTIFAAMQLTDDQRILGNLAAGPLEDFLAL